MKPLRKQKVASSGRQYGVIEPDGTLTGHSQQPQQPVTAEMLGLTPKDTGLPARCGVGRQAGRPLAQLLRLDARISRKPAKNQSIAHPRFF